MYHRGARVGLRAVTAIAVLAGGEDHLRPDSQEVAEELPVLRDVWL